MKRMLLSALLLVVAIALPRLLAADTVSAGAIESLNGCTANALPASDDAFSDAVALPFTLDFFGSTYDSLYVNNNGNVTFDSPLPSATLFNLLTTARVIIAPFFADVDTRGEGSGVVTYGATSFGGRPAFCVNWVNVGFYSLHADPLNSFQLLLVDRSDVEAGDFDIMMNYDTVGWETGDASGGTDGLGGNSARVGYSNGVDKALELSGSGVNGAFLDSDPDGLIHGRRNSVVDGSYIFPVRNDAPNEPGFTPLPTNTPPPTATDTPRPTDTASPTSTPTPTGPLTLFGDANCNGSVDSIDAALVLQYGAGLIDWLVCQGAADVNENGTVDSIDAALILQFSAGLIPGLPV